MEASKRSLAQGYSSSTYSSHCIEVKPPQTLQVYLSSNLSYFTTDIPQRKKKLKYWEGDRQTVAGKRGTKRARKVVGHDGEMGREGQDKLKNWPGKTRVYWQRACHQQVGGKQPSRTEERWTEELNEAEGRKQRYDELPRREELVETAGKAMEARPDQEAFVMWLGEKTGRFGQGARGGRECLTEALELSTEGKRF